ncbi:MAG: hypothetical protein ACYTG0_39920, partial [Planctomycetota bacterium]
MLRSRRDFDRPRAVVLLARMGAIVLCGLLAAGSCGVATTNETQEEKPPVATAAKQSILPVESTKGDEPAKRPER